MSQVIPASTEVFQFTWKSQYDTGLETTNNVMEEEEEQEEQSQEEHSDTDNNGDEYDD